jgi:hypothetical protein
MISWGVWMNVITLAKKKSRLCGLLENHFYFAHCKECLGSSEDLFPEMA